jgi:hypothetical protein
MRGIVAPIANIIYIMCIWALDTFVDANIRKDVVAGAGVGSGLAAQGSAFSAARASVTISR